MTITQIIEIPASRRITLEVPPQIPLGRVILSYTPENPAEKCSICANSVPNAETIAAIQEGRAMMRGEIPAKRFRSLDEMWEDLERHDPELDD